MTFLAAFLGVFRDLPGALAEAGRDARDAVVSLFADDTAGGAG